MINRAIAKMHTHSYKGGKIRIHFMPINVEKAFHAEFITEEGGKINVTDLYKDGESARREAERRIMER